MHRIRCAANQKKAGPNAHDSPSLRDANIGYASASIWLGKICCAGGPLEFGDVSVVTGAERRRFALAYLTHLGTVMTGVGLQNIVLSGCVRLGS